MPFFKNIWGSGNTPKFRNSFLGPDTKIGGNSNIQENVTVGVNYKIMIQISCYWKKCIYPLKYSNI